MRHDASKKTNPLYEIGDSLVIRKIKDLISIALGIPQTQQINHQLDHDFFHSLQELFHKKNITIEITGEENLKELDLSRPIAIVQNHPHGVLDALVTAYLCETRLHKNYRGFANRILKEVLCFPDSMVIPADNQSTEKNKKTGMNQKALKLSRRQLKDGGILINSPAGEVSYLRMIDGKVMIKDAPWFDTPFRLAMMTDAQILPLKISGRNSLLFYFIRLFGRTPGRMFLFWEYIMAKNKKINVQVKKPIQAGTLETSTLGHTIEQVYNSLYENK